MKKASLPFLTIPKWSILNLIKVEIFDLKIHGPIMAIHLHNVFSSRIFLILRLKSIILVSLERGNLALSFTLVSEKIPCEKFSPVSG